MSDNSQHTQQNTSQGFHIPAPMQSNTAPEKEEFEVSISLQEDALSAEDIDLQKTDENNVDDVAIEEPPVERDSPLAKAEEKLPEEPISKESSSLSPPPLPKNIKNPLEESHFSCTEEDSDDIPPDRIEVGKQMIMSLFDYIRDNAGSDMHITSNHPPKMRRFGEIESLPGAPNLTKQQTEEMIRATMTAEKWKEFKQTQDVDFSYVDSKGRRYRCNAMDTLKGIVGVYRIISEKIMSFEELHLPECVRDIMKFKKGLILVTGSAGCGKSTTLATLVEMMNEQDEGHILTIEDPVEILHTSKKSLVNHREVNTHTKSFSRALKSALREDPDCIMIGEMRDLETISLALTAAETGHLVFGTLHTSSAPNTITRIIDVFPSGEQSQIRAMLAEGVQCVLSQVLCKRRDGKGRIAAYEVMLGTVSVRNLIRKDKIFQLPSTISTGMRYGMQTLDQALQKLVNDGLIDVKEARLHAKDPKEIREIQ